MTLLVANFGRPTNVHDTVADVADEPGRLVLQLRCMLNGDRERVFKALTEPETLTKWWGPSGFATPGIELDLRVGGHYRFSMQPPDGEVFHLAGEFLEITAPSRLAYTFRWEEPDPDDRETVVRLTMDRVGEATQLTLTHGDFATEARRVLHRDGWNDSFEKLRVLIESDQHG